MNLDVLIKDLDYELQDELEDVYGLWSWHPGMG